MDKSLFSLSPQVKKALVRGEPVLALESTILAHGMPFPQNFEFGKKAEEEASSFGVVPATIAILDGMIHVGLSEKELMRVCKDKTLKKTARRDLGGVISSKQSGATTVSATMQIAHAVGIRVFATGGIGGVHREAEKTGDISQDLNALGEIPLIVVSAGAKAILDLSKTLEYLETLGVPVVGYKTDFFPAFYSRNSGIKLTERVEKPEDVARWYKAHLGTKLNTALLVVNPVSEQSEIPGSKIEKHIAKAIELSKNRGVSGKELTPFLLENIYESTEGKSLEANRALAINNVSLGAKIAAAITDPYPS